MKYIYSSIGWMLIIICATIMIVSPNIIHYLYVLTGVYIVLLLVLLWDYI